MRFQHIRTIKYSKIKGKHAHLPEGYHHIRVDLVFSIKHNRKYKPHLVDYGHLTKVPLESVYSGVVSLRGLQIVIFLEKFNKLKLKVTHIVNAYLEDETKEKPN